MAAKYILEFAQIDKEDIPLVGGKGANLGEMTQAGFPVPPGFAVTTAAYDAFLAENNLVDQIQELVFGLDTSDAKLLQQTAKKIQHKILRAEIPDDVAKEAKEFYTKLSGKSPVNVAVRSSATAEDLPGMSFAGQQATFLNIKGNTNLLVAIRECWASLFTARAIFYRAQNKIPEKKVKISVIVQKMIQSRVSGVMFTIDPVTNDKERIVIESVWGLGEMIVQGSVTPDTYVVQKDTFAILSKVVSDQSVMLTKVGVETKETKVPDKDRPKQKITDTDIVALAKIGQKLQEHYFFPQDVEWAKEEDALYIVQTRPVTTIGKKAKASSGGTMEAQAPILTGAGASPGVASGEVNIVGGPEDISKVHEGDVLVAKMTSPDYVPAMKKASAIVTDEGGQTSHAAIVSRELGIPAVVGTKTATKVLKNESVVTVDGAKGLVFAGGEVKSANSRPKVHEKIVKTKTKTRVYVNLGEPEMVSKVSKKRVDGVGLLRAEFMIANIGMHPKESIKQKTQGVFIDKLTADLTTFCKGFSPRPVVYRATDFKTNEYRALPGGKAWEPEEPNPLLGFRGAYRYLANPDAFNLELEAIKNVRKKYKNLWLMIPFVRSPEELARVRKIVETAGLFEDNSFKFWMMVELPINVILIEDFIKVGIDGVSIGSNDLTMLVTGTDRDNPQVAETFNERSKAIYWSLRRVIRKCNKYGVTSSICGQAPSSYEDLVEKLVKYGITSISVNPDAINRVRGVIAQTEKELIS